VKGSERNTVRKSNKNGQGVDTGVSRVARYLREWHARHSQTVHSQIIRGASYSLGSGAVSLIIIWFENRF
jgi:hypothetical protein